MLGSVSTAIKDTVISGLTLSTLFAPSQAVYGGEQDGKEDNKKVVSVDAEIIEAPTITKLDKLKETPQFIALNPETQEKVLELFRDKLTPEQQGGFQKIVERSVLFDKDSQGKSLLENVIELASTPTHIGLAPYRNELIASFLSEIGDPGELNQAAWGVCGVSGMYDLYLTQPSETARLFKGLISEEGKVEWKKGVSLVRPRFAIPADTKEGRGRSHS